MILFYFYLCIAYASNNVMHKVDERWSVRARLAELSYHLNGRNELLHHLQATNLHPLLISDPPPPLHPSIHPSTIISGFLALHHLLCHKLASDTKSTNLLLFSETMYPFDTAIDIDSLQTSLCQAIMSEGVMSDSKVQAACKKVTSEIASRRNRSTAISLILGLTAILLLIILFYRIHIKRKSLQQHQ